MNKVILVVAVSFLVSLQPAFAGEGRDQTDRSNVRHRITSGDGMCPAAGVTICNAAVAGDLVSVFAEVDKVHSPLVCAVLDMVDALSPAQKLEFFARQSSRLAPKDIELIKSLLVVRTDR